ncbi:MAG TPA: hypothetical protein DEP84_25965 [Chloroflexi bacterium]|nr:hypothetical protein [Chloroflexota bacterium]
MPVIRHILIPNSYHDSVFLMELSRGLGERPGVEAAGVMMGTPANVAVLVESGLLAERPEGVSPADLVIAAAAGTDVEAAEALEWATRSLTAPAGRTPPDSPSGGAPAPRVGRWQWRELPESARLALISTPGRYAAAEAWKALRAGRHVALFSDHVPVEDEVALKQAARDRGLLVMGPECGTAIIGGVPLGFANRLRRGPIGLIAASGSGLQEVTCLIDRLGSGVSHAIGTGGRDLSAAVGGLTMQQGIDLLLGDEATRMLVLLSKPPDPQVAASVLRRVAHARKPVVVCFLGGDPEPIEAAGASVARTLEEAARLAVELATQRPIPAISAAEVPETPVRQGEPPLLCGLFAGGTLAYEAMLVLRAALGPIWSNAPLDSDHRLPETGQLPGHTCLDLGAEEFTAGQPHPMIDGTRRAARLLDVAADPRVGVILLDVILGLGSEPDPAGTLLPAIAQARQIAGRGERTLHVVASVTGTADDPQPYAAQVEKLTKERVVVAESNAAAARAAAALVMA